MMDIISSALDANHLAPEEFLASTLDAQEQLQQRSSRLDIWHFRAKREEWARIRNAFVTEFKQKNELHGADTLLQRQGGGLMVSYKWASSNSEKWLWSLPLSPGVLSVWSKEKPWLLFIRSWSHQDRLLLLLLAITRRIITLLIHIIVSNTGNITHGVAPFLSTQLIPGTKGFLCRKQSQLCRVRIGSQSERGGWYDVSPPHRPLVRNRRTKPVGWRAWSESGNRKLLLKKHRQLLR